ncbi:MAG: sensor histidine kinase [Cyclobacteriaceae bacterium]
MKIMVEEKERLVDNPDEILFISSNGNYKKTYNISKVPFLKLASTGYLDYESVKEFYAHFDMLLNVLEMNGIPPPYYLHIDYSKVTGVDKSGRDYYKKRLDKLFADGIIAAAAIINPSFIVRTIGIIYRKINPKLNYKFFNNEYEATEFLQKVNQSGAINSFDDYLNTDQEEGIFYLENTKINFFRNKEWQFVQDDVQVSISLLNNQCIFMQFKGKPNILQIKSNVETCKKIIEKLNCQNLCLVLDILKMEMPSLKVRKFAADITAQTKQLWNYRYIVVPSRLKIIYQIIKLFQPRSLENSKAVEDLSEALVLCQQRKKEKNSQEAHLSKKEDLMQLSKEDLAEKIRKMEMNQIRVSNKLFRNLSRITWDTSFTPTHLDIPSEDDAFFDLFNCVNILQDDIYCMINELQEFNRSLERQVKDRTEQLNQQNKELIKLNTEMDNFVYRVSHDLKAPLASILGLVTLNQVEKDPAKNAEYNALIKKSLVKLNDFIIDLLHLSRNSRTALVKQELNMRLLLEEIFADLNYMENAAFIEKEININASAVFYNDEKRIKIIMTNLIGNAIKYNLPKYKKAFIKINVEINSIACTIKVCDNGMGIAKQYQENIFEMFYRATDKGNGTGIGLYIVKEVVNRLNGKISVESEFGKGSTFTLVIPNMQLDN